MQIDGYDGVISLVLICGLINKFSLLWNDDLERINKFASIHASKLKHVCTSSLSFKLSKNHDTLSSALYQLKMLLHILSQVPLKVGRSLDIG